MPITVIVFGAIVLGTRLTIAYASGDHRCKYDMEIEPPLYLKLRMFYSPRFVMYYVIDDGAYLLYLSNIYLYVMKLSNCLK